MIHRTTAQFPGVPWLAACQRIVDSLPAGADACVQLCPQSAGALTMAVADALRARFPGLRFQLHANVALRPGSPERIDASTVCAETLPWFRRTAAISRRLGAARYSLHAGRRQGASFAQMADNLRRLAQEMELPVAVEGLYPAPGDPFLLSTWQEYRRLLNNDSDSGPDSGLHFAIDLSHLHILHCREPADPGLVRALLASPRCLEIHISDNDGRADQHRPLPDPPDQRWWWPLLMEAVRWSRAEVFDEARSAALSRKTDDLTPLTPNTASQAPARQNIIPPVPVEVPDQHLIKPLLLVAQGGPALPPAGGPPERVTGH